AEVKPCGCFHDLLRPDEPRIQRDHRDSVRPQLGRHIGGHLVGRGFRNTIGDIPNVLLCFPEAKVHDHPPPLTNHSRHSTLAWKFARTPALNIASQRRSGCSQNGLDQVNAPFSTIRSYPPHTLFTRISIPALSRATDSNADATSTSTRWSQRIAVMRSCFGA